VIVGAMGIANIMIISVRERRTEIGRRAALGARRRPVATQFVVESLLLCGLGAVAGIARGVGDPCRAAGHVDGDGTRPLGK
jgi:putative ABC transport system permease protein